MKNWKASTITGCLSALLLTAGSPAWADSRAGHDQTRMSVSLTIAHPVRMQVQSDVICLYNHGARTFSMRQTQGARAFDHNESLPSRYRTLDNDQCKNGQALQLDVEPDRGQQYALLHVLIEPD